VVLFVDLVVTKIMIESKFNLGTYFYLYFFKFETIADVNDRTPYLPQAIVPITIT